jgi:hypothetical protein|uniref:Uncharacterized protein n=1 Tax=viral metagenome TaxID=1070528 RepID=A0A6C0HZ02_9ZZZZ
MAPNNYIVKDIIIRANKRVMISKLYAKVGNAIGVSRQGGMSVAPSSSCSTRLCYDSYTRVSCCPNTPGCNCV